MSSSIKTSTIALASVGTIVTGFIAYAIYFDHKRRNDPEFRKSLKREARQLARAAKEESEAAGIRQRREIQNMVDEAKEEGFPEDAEDKEVYFMQEVGRGEQLSQDSSQEIEAALSFYKALKVYPQKKELMGIYDKTIPKPVLDILSEMVAYDRTLDSHGNGSPTSSTAGVE